MFNETSGVDPLLPEAAGGFVATRLPTILIIDILQDFPYWTRVISPDWAHRK
jgi:hypothetical protein